MRRRIASALTALPWLAYVAVLARAVWGSVGEAFAGFSDNLMLMLTLVALLWIEREVLLAALRHAVQGQAALSWKGVVMFIPVALLLFVGDLTSFALEAWALCLLPAALLCSFPVAQLSHRRAAWQLAVAGSVVVLIGRIAPAVLSADLAMHLARGAAAVLTFTGLPVAADGVRLFFGPYVAEVTEACAGMNSIFALTALSLFYMRQGHVRTPQHMAVLALAVVPIAIATNFTRIVLLVLSTRFVGDRFAQGAFHDAAGLMAFVIALALVLGLDSLLCRLKGRTQAAGQTA
jgi:exosortase/archaeosortase family protein